MVVIHYIKFWRGKSGGTAQFFHWWPGSHHVSAEISIKKIQPMVNWELVWSRCSWANNGLGFQIRVKWKGYSLYHTRYHVGTWKVWTRFNRAQASLPQQGPRPSYLLFTSLQVVDINGFSLLSEHLTSLFLGWSLFVLDVLLDVLGCSSYVLEHPRMFWNVQTFLEFSCLTLQWFWFLVQL